MEVVYSTLGYILLTFPLAFFWHIKIFRSQYEKWQYFGNNAQPLLGLLSMIIQGIFLSVVYRYFSFSDNVVTNVSLFSILMFILFWTIHVLSTMAKTTETRNFSFFMMESVYLLVQFALFGLVLAIIQ